MLASKIGVRSELCWLGWNNVREKAATWCPAGPAQAGHPGSPGRGLAPVNVWCGESALEPALEEPAKRTHTPASNKLAAPGA